MTLPKVFVYLSELDNTIIGDIRYCKESNFIGRPIEGYKKERIIMTELAANSITQVQKEVLNDGYSLVIYDAYRPLKACNDFTSWSKNTNDNKMQDIFYPSISKQSAFGANGYVSQKSPHCRGSTVDLSIIKIGKKLTVPKLEYRMLRNNNIIPYYHDGTEDMGTSFDFFGKESHTNFSYISEQAQKNRKYLVEIMIKHGFRNHLPGWGDDPKEWWHFTLDNEPFNDTYFDFDVE
jgi:zinc D-Ala-D-Ala dipeptidase